VCAPLALHDATLTDFAPDHSLVAALRMAGLRNVFVTDWRSASPEMRFFSIDSYLASCIAADLSPDFQHLSAVGSVAQRGGSGAPGAAARRHARLIRAPIPRISQPALPDVRARLKRTALLAKPMNGINAPQRPDCVAGHVGLELRNVDANYPFERSHRFAGIQPNSGFGDYSRLSCGVGDTQLGRRPGSRQGCLRGRQQPSWGGFPGSEPKQRRGYAARGWVLPGSSASVLHGRWRSCGVAEKARIGRDPFRSEDDPPAAKPATPLLSLRWTFRAKR